jgi:DNA polymerase III delta prime subunit
VVILNECHQLTNEAWDVFLAVLEADGDSVAFIFTTTDESKVPATIKSRCMVLRFGAVPTEDLTGKLTAIADEQGISYTADGLLTVARYAHGRPRDAVKGLEMVAACGPVTKTEAESVLNYNAPTIGKQIYVDLIRKQLPDAVAKADELTQRIGPSRVIQMMFSLYAQDAFTGRDVNRLFAPLPQMSQFFLKWSGVHHLPSDVIPLFVLELSELLHAVKHPPVSARVPEHSGTQPSPVQPATSVRVTSAEFRRKMSD